MRCDETVMRLYAVTDRAWTGEKTLYEQVEAALKGGVTCVQLREKDLPREEIRKEAVQLCSLCRQYGVPFLINDDVELAVECGADGVHVGQKDMEAGRARALLGEGKILGVSARTVEQALEAQKNGADYLGVGAVFSTSTKQDAKALPHETLRAICDAVSIPVVAIGGIKKENMLQLSGCGADGVALVSAIFSAQDIELECRTLRAMSEEMTKGAIR